MKKKLFSILLVAAMLCSFLVPTAFAASTVGTYTSADATGSKVTVSDKTGNKLTVTVTQSGTADTTASYDFGVFSKSGDIATNYTTLTEFLETDTNQNMSDLVNNTGATNLYDAEEISYAGGSFTKEIDLSAQAAGHYYVVVWTKNQTNGGTGVEIEIDEDGALVSALAITEATVTGPWTYGTEVSATKVAEISGGTKTSRSVEVTSGTLPAGLSLAIAADGTVNISGTPTAAGSAATIQITVKDSGNTTGVVSNNITLPAVGKAKLSIAAASPATDTVTVGATKDISSKFSVKGLKLTDTAAAVTTISYSSGTTANATIDTAGVVTGVAAGNSVITATLALNGAQANYELDAATTATITVTVSAGAPNTVNAGADKTVTYGDAKFTQVATATAGTVGYTSSATDVATVNATTGEVTILKHGTTTITATVPAGTYGGTTYAEGTDSYTLTVSPKALNVTFSGNTVGAKLDTVTYALDGVVSPDTVSINTLTWTNLGNNDEGNPNTPADITLAAGTYSYTVTLDNNTDGNYTITSPGTMTVADNAPVVPTNNFTVTYNAGLHGSLAAGSATSEKVKKGEKPVNVPEVVAEKGYTFVGWSADGRTLVNPAEETITRSVTFTALYADHNAYMVGRSTTTFEPNGQMTRAEAAAVLSRLTAGFEEDGEYTAAPYSDLDTSAWYITYVNFAAEKGIIKGYEDGTFRPNAPITRAELATMIAGYMKVAAIDDPAVSSDVAGHWAEGLIAALEKAQVIKGYEDGTFRPNQNITRAEAATMVNGAIDREPQVVDLEHDGYVNPFTDVAESAWYFEEVMEATVAHLIAHFHAA